MNSEEFKKKDALRSREYRKANSEKIALRRKEKRMQNPERQREIASLWRLANPERMSIYSKRLTEVHGEARRLAARKRRAEDPRIEMLAQARKRAKAKGIDFSISKEDIFIPTHCPVLLIPLIPGTGKFGPARGSPSLDRIDDSLGYVKGNVQVISHKANTAKNNLSPSDLLKMANWITNTFGIVGTRAMK